MKPGFTARTIEMIRSLYKNEDPVPLHAPRFLGNEKKYLADCVDSTFVSSVGKCVDEFERACAAYCGAAAAVSTVNGTAALHTALVLAGVGHGDGVITQPLSFVATVNAVAYTGASPVFVDVDRDTMSLSPSKLEAFLQADAERRDGALFHRPSGLRLRACVLMHTLGHPGRVAELAAVCDRYGIILIEDAAEALGSYCGGRHAGTFGRAGVLSFNGNKIITTGGGGMLLFNDKALAGRAKHLTTTAKVPHPWGFAHDAVGYNYRLPNLNAALGLAQLEQLDGFLTAKRAVAAAYGEFFAGEGVPFIREPEGARSNYWLNGIVFDDIIQRDEFLKATNEARVMTRPLWQCLDSLAPYSQCPRGDLGNAGWLQERVVNIPSSVPR